MSPDVGNETLAEAQAADSPAAPKEVKTPTTPPEATAEAAAEVTHPYQNGTWHGHPNFKCPHCAFATLEGPGVVDDHIEQRHPAAWLAGV